MCDCDMPAFYSEEYRRARRPHRCVECGGAIASGARYQHASGKWDGDLRSYATCLTCAEVRESLGRATGCCVFLGAMFADATYYEGGGLRLRLDDVELGDVDEDAALASVAGLWFRWREHLAEAA